jgi:hypothetical protein
LFVTIHHDRGSRSSTSATTCASTCANNLPRRTSRSVPHQEPARPGRISLDAAWCPRRLRAGLGRPGPGRARRRSSSASLSSPRSRRARWCGDAAGRRRQRSRSAPFDLPLWARTIMRAVGHERLLAIKACCRASPRFRLISEIKYYIGSREAAVMQDPILPAGCGASWGSWTGQAPPVLCRAPALLAISAGERANGVSARREVFTFGADLGGCRLRRVPPTG